MADETPTGTLNVFVPGITLIPQKTSKTCWYASAMMMYKWKTARGGTVPNPDDDRKNTSRRDSDVVLPWGEMLEFGKSLGMAARPLMTPTPETFAEWLSHGPMWTDGIFVDGEGKTTPSGHITVVAGIRSVPSSDGYEVFIYDPDPPQKGSAKWRPISHLVAILVAGGHPAVACNFLYYP